LYHAKKIACMGMGNAKSERDQRQFSAAAAATSLSRVA
jgi:hypothetical protein